MIKVTCEVSTYDESAKPNIKVHNHWCDDSKHWCDDSKVEIEVNGEIYVVAARDIIKAIRYCTNTGGI